MPSIGVVVHGGHRDAFGAARSLPTNGTKSVLAIIAPSHVAVPVGDRVPDVRRSQPGFPAILGCAQARPRRRQVARR
jgi:hypothetical protein